MLAILGLLLTAEAARTCRVPGQGTVSARLISRTEIEANEARRAAFELRPPEPITHGLELGAVGLLWESDDVDWVSPSEYTVVISRGEQPLSRTVPQPSVDTGGRADFVGHAAVPLGARPPLTISVVAGSAWACRFDVDERGRIRANLWR